MGVLEPDERGKGPANVGCPQQPAAKRARAIQLLEERVGHPVAFELLLVLSCRLGPRDPA